MFKALRNFADHLFTKASDGYEASIAHPGADARAKAAREALTLAALAEQGKTADTRQRPGTVPYAPRLTPEQERKRIDDMPVP